MIKNIANENNNFSKNNFSENLQNLNFQKKKNSGSDIDKSLDNFSNISNLSRITINRKKIKDILTNRKKYKIFNSDNKDQKWFYFENKKEIGPISTSEMNLKFQNFDFTEKTKIRKNEEKKYYLIKILIKRIYKQIFEEEKDSVNNLFIKKDIIEKGNHFKKSRKDRVLSMAERPKLLFLKNMVNTDSSSESEEIETRQRAKTLTD